MALAPARAMFAVHATKAGGLPISRAVRKGHAVTLVRNVSGDARALLHALQQATGAGGTVHDDGRGVELQGSHENAVSAWILASGCAKGVAGSGKSKAAAAAKAEEEALAKAAKADADLPKQRAKPRHEKRPAAYASIIVDDHAVSGWAPPKNRKRTEAERYDAFLRLMQDRWPYWSREPSELPGLYHSFAGQGPVTGAAVLEARPGERVDAGGEETFADDPLAAFSIEGASRRERAAAAKVKQAKPAPAAVAPAPTPIAWTPKDAAPLPASYAHAATTDGETAPGEVRRPRNRLGQAFDPRRAMVRSQISRNARGPRGGASGRVFVKQRHRGGAAGRAALWGDDDDGDGGDEDEDQGPMRYGSAADWFRGWHGDHEDHEEEEEEEENGTRAQPALDSWFTAQAPPLPGRGGDEPPSVRAFAAASADAFAPRSGGAHAVPSPAAAQQVLPHLLQPAELSEEEALALALAQSAEVAEDEGAWEDDWDDSDGEEVWHDDNAGVPPPPSDGDAWFWGAAPSAVEPTPSAALPTPAEEEAEQLAAAIAASLREAGGGEPAASQLAHPSGTWACSACTLENEAEAECCVVCGTPSPRVIALASG